MKKKIDYIKCNILGVLINNLNIQDVLIMIFKKINIYTTKHFIIFTPNVDFLVNAYYNNYFKKVLNSSDICVPDGKPLIWASKFLGNPLKEKVAGSDLFFKLCDKSRLYGYKIFLLGSMDDIAFIAKNKLEHRFPGINIVGAYSPSYNFNNNHREINKIINMIMNAKPDILFVGVGSPKQEFFIHNYKDQYKVPISIGVGASIDFAAGVKKIPPTWMKNIGLAWLWRLFSDPKRLWKRYLIKDMKFFYYVFLQKIGKLNIK